MGGNGGAGSQPVNLGREPLGTRPGEPVVAAQPAVHDLFAVYLDEPIALEPVQRGIQGPGAQPDPAAPRTCAAPVMIP